MLFMAVLVTAQALAKPNLILVSIDGMRADRAGYMGVDPSPTPNLDRLAADGLVCELALSQSNESLFSHASMLTGRHVSELGVPDYRRFTVSDDALSVPEILAIYGYSTAAFVAGGHVKGTYGFAQGFSVFYDEPDFGAFFHTVPVALDWLERDAIEPFFMFLHGYDPHRPYHHTGLFYHVFGADYDGVIDQLADRTDVERIIDGVYYPDFPIRFFWHQEVGDKILDPGGYAMLRAWAAENEGMALTQADRLHLRDHYDSGLLAADLQLGRVVDRLKASGRWEDTLLLITSDHGEDLGDHGLYNHRSTLADSATRVPFVLAGGALAADRRGQRVPGPCAAIDVVPTLLAAAEATPPAGLYGRDVLGDSPQHQVVIQEGVLPMMAVRSPTHRLMVEGLPLDSPLLQLMVQVAPFRAPTFKLYDLSRDPAEQRDVLQAQPEIALELRAALLTWLKEREASEHVGTQPLDPEFQELLRSRGYW